ncbi:MAG: rod shape-determining protein RodA [Pseudomonadota bacterium]|nr:rod shape-determining protein RodA [Pseudomonadota bacterium]
MAEILLPGRRRGLRERLSRLHWPLIVLLTMIAGAGVITLYSAAEGSWQPWAFNHATRYAVSLVMLICIGLIGIRYWMALAYPIYFFALATLALVPFMGEVIMGAQRWIVIGGMQFQPSSVMKIGLVLALARYYHGLRAEQVSHILYLIPPLLMIGAPVGLIFMEPDLGTALLIGATGVTIVFLAGLSLRIAAVGAVGAVVAGYFAYRFNILKQYQIERILTFMDPDRDPLGKGYHLLQSKIALGSGGLDGKGFMEGSQSQLKFLPELQTDFIFTIFGEEFGFVGAIALLALYLAVILTGIGIALNAKTHFARLATMGVIVTFTFYVMINTGMVMGLAPVVGVPLPLVSYGGTMMLTIMAGFGIVMSAYLSRDQDGLGGRGGL